MDVRVQSGGECPPHPRSTASSRPAHCADRYGFDNPLRYFTTEMLVVPARNWKVTPADCGMPGCGRVDGGSAACWSCLTPPWWRKYVGAAVKHLPTGHIWVTVDEEPEPWNGTHIHLGRWPD